MYPSLLSLLPLPLSLLLLLPLPGVLALPSTSPNALTTTTPLGTLTLASSDSPSNATRLLSTVNGFPDPAVHCSGRSLSDSGDADYSSDLNAAVTASGDDGLYGACNVNGDAVDGDGALAFRSGTVQVYFCNHAFAATSCDLNEYWRADALITAECGADGGGWVTISDWSLTIGRDPTNSDGSFRSECGDSLHGVNENFAVTNSTRKP